MASITARSPDGDRMAMVAVSTGAPSGVIPVGPGRTGVVFGRIVDAVGVFAVVAKASMVVRSIRGAGCRMAV